MTRIITGRRFSPFQPRNGVIEALLLHEVDTDIVIGIAELGVELNGDLTLSDGLVEPALKL